MRCNEVNEMEWMTVKEAGKIADVSVHTFRPLINRGKAEMMKKIQDNGSGYWALQRDHLTGAEKMPSQDIIPEPSQMVSIPAETYVQLQKDHDAMVQGLMMYRYKFEQAEKQLHLLPAPAEVVTSHLMETEEALKAEVEYREQLIEALEEKEAKIQEQKNQLIALGMELVCERSLPWWKRVMRKRKM